VTARPGPVCLVVLDGWGIAEPGPGNAIALARTPIYDRLAHDGWVAALAASGPAVGLPAGQMGNSEVGHLTLGAGAAVPQTLTLIDEQVRQGALRDNAVIVRSLTATERVHLIAMVSDGGVHSSLHHLLAIIELARSLGTRDLVVHAITDGRDTAPDSATGFMSILSDALVDGGRVGTLCGRWWAMDRDRRWERTQASYDLLVHGRAAHHEPSALAAVEAAYTRGETDEFIAPTLVGGEARIRADDSVLCVNFRPDRMRQLVRALAEPGFGEGDGPLPGWRGRGDAGPVRRVATMTAYQRDWSYPVAFPAAHAPATLGAAVQQAGLTQLRIAETEKYAHVTYFFNGGREEPYEGETRVLVPSRRDVPTYDLAPEMSARPIAAALAQGLRDACPALVVLNLANADMVGHTGSLEATIAAVQTVDGCLGEITAAVHAAGGTCLITADHGNAEQMRDPDGGPCTTHTTNPVPLIVSPPMAALRTHGSLADVAPTVLALLGCATPPGMDGTPLLAGRWVLEQPGR